MRMIDAVKQGVVKRPFGMGFRTASVPMRAELLSYIL